MLIYKNTFENVRTLNCDFPIEDQFYASENEAIIADGVTRDPIGVDDFSKYSLKELLAKYPRPSGATLAAKEICNTFSKTSGSLKNRLIECNKSVKKLNDKYIVECDYLENDYYSSVASCVHIENDILNYAYICDCGVIVYDKFGNIKFQTKNDKEIDSDPYAIVLPWNLKETRVHIRKTYRNNLNTVKDGKCISFGVLTGEESAIHFIKEGQIKLSKGDLVLVYSDGFSKFLHDQDFISQIINFEKEKFENYISSKSLEDAKKYGVEKSLIVFKN